MRIVSLVIIAAFWVHGINQDLTDDESRYAGAQNFRFALIQVPVWVTDKRTRRVDGLKQRNFELRVDGGPVRIERFRSSYEEPLEVVFLMDVSGSMELGRKYEASVMGLHYVVDHLNEADRWRCIVFGEQALGELADSQRPSDLEQLDRIEPYGKTGLYDALSQADSFFSRETLGNRVLILFTDGNDTSSNMTEPEVLEILRVLDVPIFVLGIADGFLPSDPTTDEPVNIEGLRTIAEISGGLTLVARDSSEFPRFVAQLNGQLRAHYLLAFTVERGEGERRHDIEVSVNKRKYDVRHRKGYVGYSAEFLPR